MCQRRNEKRPEVKSDSFKLDFGKNEFHVEEKVGEPDQFERKLPPEPGRVPPATSVSWGEVLNPLPKGQKNQKK